MKHIRDIIEQKIALGWPLIPSQEEPKEWLTEDGEDWYYWTDQNGEKHYS